MKDNKGVTLFILIVTIIVMLILLGVGTSIGMNSLQHSKMVKFVSYMQTIQKQVDMYTSEELETLGSTVPNTSQATSILNQCPEISDKNVNNYRYFNKEMLSENFDINNVDDNIIVNFNTREVVSLTRDRIR